MIVFLTFLLGHEYRYKWSQSEKNPVFKDVFERDLQIAHIRFDAFQKFIAKVWCCSIDMFSGATS